MFGRCRIGEKHWTDDSGIQGTTNVMKLIGLFIILASLENQDGSYRYAVKDTCGKTYQVMMLEKKTIGDTISLGQN